MNALTRGISDGVRLIVHGDPEVVDLTLTTLRVGLESTAIGALVAVPLGCALGLGGFRGHRVAQTLVNAGLRFPPVALGHLLWILLWPESIWGPGPFAGLGWVYTINAVILAQTLLVIPVVAALTASAVRAVPGGLLDQAQAFGASFGARTVLALREARVGVIAALLSGLGIAIASVGAVVVVGGPLAQYTLAGSALLRWQISGQDALAVAYGTVLLLLFVLLSTSLTLLGQGRVRWLPGRA